MQRLPSSLGPAMGVALAFTLLVFPAARSHAAAAPDLVPFRSWTLELLLPRGSSEWRGEIDSDMEAWATPIGEVSAFYGVDVDDLPARRIGTLRVRGEPVALYRWRSWREKEELLATFPRYGSHRLLLAVPIDDADPGSRRLAEAIIASVRQVNDVTRLVAHVCSEDGVVASAAVTNESGRATDVRVGSVVTNRRGTVGAIDAAGITVRWYDWDAGRWRQRRLANAGCLHREREGPRTGTAATEAAAGSGHFVAAAPPFYLSCFRIGRERADVAFSRAMAEFGSAMGVRSTRVHFISAERCGTTTRISVDLIGDDGEIDAWTAVVPDDGAIELSSAE